MELLVFIRLRGFARKLFFDNEGGGLLRLLRHPVAEDHIGGVAYDGAACLAQILPVARRVGFFNRIGDPFGNPFKRGGFSTFKLQGDDGAGGSNRLSAIDGIGVAFSVRELDRKGEHLIRVWIFAHHFLGDPQAAQRPLGLVGIDKGQAQCFRPVMVPV